MPRGAEGVAESKGTSAGGAALGLPSSVSRPQNSNKTSGIKSPRSSGLQTVSRQQPHTVPPLPEPRGLRRGSRPGSKRPVWTLRSRPHGTSPEPGETSQIPLAPQPQALPRGEPGVGWGGGISPGSGPLGDGLLRHGASSAAAPDGRAEALPSLLPLSLSPFLFLSFSPPPPPPFPPSLPLSLLPAAAGKEGVGEGGGGRRGAGLGGAGSSSIPLAGGSALPAGATAAGGGNSRQPEAAPRAEPAA